MVRMFCLRFDKLTAPLSLYFMLFIPSQCMLGPQHFGLIVQLGLLSFIWVNPCLATLLKFRIETQVRTMPPSLAIIVVGEEMENILSDGTGVYLYFHFFFDLYLGLSGSLLGGDHHVLIENCVDSFHFGDIPVDPATIVRRTVFYIYHIVCYS